MRRKILNFTTTLSGMTCLAVCVLWVQSYQEAAGVACLGRRTEHKLHSYRGSLVYVHIVSMHDIPGEVPFIIAFWNGDSFGGDVEGVISHPPFLSRDPDLHDASAMPFRWVDLDAWEGSDRIGLNPFLAGRGFLFGTSPTGPYPETGATAVGVPHWLVAAMTALAPALSLRAQARCKRRQKAGLGRFCGYDLRATPERCPECGAIPKGAA